MWSTENIRFCGKYIEKQPKTSQNSLFSAVFGRASPLKSELRRRGTWQGFTLHIPDDWGRQLAAGRASPLKSELHRRGTWQGFTPHTPDDWGRQLAAGRASPLKSELRRRGTWQGFTPHIPDDWGRQLAAGTSVHNRPNIAAQCRGGRNIFPKYRKCLCLQGIL